MPKVLGTFNLSNGRKKTNRYVFVIDGFKTNNVFYTDAVSLYNIKIVVSSGSEKTSRGKTGKE